MRWPYFACLVLLSLSCHQGLKNSITEVNRLVSAEKYEEATKSAEASLIKYPGEPKLQEPYIRALIQVGRLTEARVAYSQLRLKGGDNKEILTLLASTTLTEAAKDPEVERRRYLLSAFERTPGSFAIGPLLEILSDEDLKIRLWTIQVLGLIPGLDSQNALSKLLEETTKDKTLQLGIAAALLRKGDQAGKKLLEVALTGKNDLHAVLAAKAFADVGDNRGLKFAERALGAKDEQVALGAIAAMGAMDGKLVVKSLQKAMADPRASIRIEAAKSAGIQGSQALIPSLRTLLTDPDPKVKQSAAASLGALADKDSAETLRAVMLDDPDPSVRLNAAQALRRLNDELGFQFVFDAVHNGGNPTLRALMLEDLGQLGDTNFVEDVRGAVKDKSPEVRAAALIALGQLQDVEAGKLSVSCLNDESSEVRLAVARTLAVVDLNDAAASLAPLLGDEEFLVRVQASISWLSRQE
jgi:HEAT repeat protein